MYTRNYCFHFSWINLIWNDLQWWMCYIWIVCPNAHQWSDWLVANGLLLGLNLCQNKETTSWIYTGFITKIVVLPNQDGLLTDLWKFKSDWRTLLIVVAIKSSVHLWWLIWVFSATPPQLSNPSDLPCYRGQVTHICVSKLTILGSNTGLSPGRPSHYLNQWWNIVNWTLENKFQWNVNRNAYIFIQENAPENVVWKMAAILSRPQYVNMVKFSPKYPQQALHSSPMGVRYGVSSVGSNS